MHAFIYIGPEGPVLLEAGLEKLVETFTSICQIRTEHMHNDYNVCINYLTNVVIRPNRLWKAELNKFLKLHKNKHYIKNNKQFISIMIFEYPTPFKLFVDKMNRPAYTFSLY